MTTEYEKQQTSQWYNPDDAEIKSLQDKSRVLMNSFNSEKDKQKRLEIMKKWLKSAGETSYIEPNVFIDFGCHVELGENVYLNTGCILLDSAKIQIGDNTMIGSGVQILTPNHPLDARERTTRQDFEIAQPVVIGKNCWIGSGAIILPNVKIGDNTTIGAGSVVTKDIPSDCVAVGNPCRVVKYLK